VDEALDALNRYLDDASLAGLDKVLIIHGMGTGAVRDAVRSAAASHLATPDAGGPDIIMAVEGTSVETPEQLRTALAKAKSGDIVTLRVYNVPAKSKRVERMRIGGE